MSVSLDPFQNIVSVGWGAGRVLVFYFRSRAIATQFASGPTDGSASASGGIENEFYTSVTVMNPNVVGELPTPTVLPGTWNAEKEPTGIGSPVNWTFGGEMDLRADVSYTVGEPEEGRLYSLDQLVDFPATAERLVNTASGTTDYGYSMDWSGTVNAVALPEGGPWQWSFIAWGDALSYSMVNLSSLPPSDPEFGEDVGRKFRFTILRTGAMEFSGWESVRAGIFVKDPTSDNPAGGRFEELTDEINMFEETALSVAYLVTVPNNPGPTEPKLTLERI